MSAHDLTLTLFGGVVGIALALLVQPLLEDKTQGLLVRLVGRFWIRERKSLAGTWASVMLSDGASLSREKEITEISLFEVRKRVAGTFSWKGRVYRLLGARQSDQYLTGTYEDVVAGHSFHGAFQLRIFPNEEIMSGRWVGFDSSNKILQGPWEWRRSEADHYAFEISKGEPKTSP